MLTKNLKTIPLHETFRILSDRSNLASVDVLRRAMSSAFEPIRLGALQALIHRGGEQEMSAILEKIDSCKDAELHLLASLVPLLMEPIQAGLAGRNPGLRQNALCAIAKLQIESQFHHLVRAAQSPDDDQQVVAAELVLGLATRFGKVARQRKKPINSTAREQLLSDLWQSCLQICDHRIPQNLDAWLCASHWDDQAFKDLFGPSRSDPVFKIVLRQLTHSHRNEIIELLAGVLWSQGPSPEAIRTIGDRTESSMACGLADLVLKCGITLNVKRNLATGIPIQCLETFDFSDDTNSTQHRNALLELLSISDLNPAIILMGIIRLLETNDPAFGETCSNALRSMKPIKPEIIVMVLSDCFKAPGMEHSEPPPWKSNLRISLERLMELYPDQTADVRSSIGFAFSDFRCEELIRHLDDWPESHLFAYAKIVRIAESGYVGTIERDAQSQSAVKRSRAIHAIRFLGMQDGLGQVAISAVEDKNEKVRVEAIQAISAGHSRREAIKILLPLLKDDDQSVQVAATHALSALEN